MFIRFRADSYQKDGKTLVDVFDHETETTETMTIAQYHIKSDYYSYNGGAIFGQRNDSSNKKADT